LEYSFFSSLYQITFFSLTSRTLCYTILWERDQGRTVEEEERSRQRIVEEEGRVAVWDSRKGSFWNEYGRRELSKHWLCKKGGTCKPFKRGKRAHVSSLIKEECSGRYVSLERV